MSGLSEGLILANQKAKAGNQYIFYAALAAAAGEFAQFQIFNPAASGRNLFVSRMVSVCRGVAEAYGTFGTVALGTVATTGPLNKVIGGAVGVGVGRVQSVVAAVGATGYGVVPIAGNVVGVIEYEVPIMVPPGYGLGFYINLAAAVCFSEIQYSEELI